ncbi:hypothetical protein C7H19_09310 [Aphanothece hegewaldii CCALA 016]|uniref:DUF4278 domain-containing protein n=1 Tax=Aphanothece hegewaldii CCALA 016 TaxID=2107694 RepID=A0A2T1LZ95_9CHRO|nr:DUF4278 domain-containing protein [Aphanothece hegewaldii]PSF37735.1 hypothetical protein C7H19_09310 [Aphanothece hegewaldii CCALA 016]
MKLTYRGVSYDYNPPVVETTDGNIGGKYRGLDWRFRNLKKPFVIQPIVKLTYRGVPYNNVGVSQTHPVEQPVTSIQEKARLSIFNQEKETRKRHQNVLNRLSSDIGL